MQETVKRRLDGIFFFLTKDQDNRYFVVRSFDWSYIFDHFAAGSI